MQFLKEKLQKANARITELENVKTTKIIDTTNEETNITVKAFKHGKIITVILYTTLWGDKELNSGHQGTILADLPFGSRPLESINQQVRTSLNNKFSLIVNSNGHIQIGYNYQNIAANSANQISEIITFVAA